MVFERERVEREVSDAINWGRPNDKKLFGGANNSIFIHRGRWTLLGSHRLMSRTLSPKLLTASIAHSLWTYPPLSGHHPKDPRSPKRSQIVWKCASNKVGPKQYHHYSRCSVSKPAKTQKQKIPASCRVFIFGISRVGTPNSSLPAVFDPRHKLIWPLFREM